MFDTWRLLVIEFTTLQWEKLVLLWAILVKPFGGRGKNQGMEKRLHVDGLTTCKPLVFVPKISW
jgi:hypothetical protein